MSAQGEAARDTCVCGCTYLAELGECPACAAAVYDHMSVAPNMDALELEMREHGEYAAPSPAATGADGAAWSPDVELVGMLYRCVGSATLPAEGHASGYHLGTMLNRMLQFTSERKFNRWVGYIQGVLVATGNGTVEQFKDMNRDRPDAHPAPSGPADARVTALKIAVADAFIERQRYPLYTESWTLADGALSEALALLSEVKP